MDVHLRDFSFNIHNHISHLPSHPTNEEEERRGGEYEMKIESNEEKKKKNIVPQIK